MADSQWPLHTSLDRLQTALNAQAERYLLTAFQRRAHHYITDPPKLEEDLEWLFEAARGRAGCAHSLAEHSGIPRR
jgi:hypothetical protein